MGRMPYTKKPNNRYKQHRSLVSNHRASDKLPKPKRSFKSKVILAKIEIVVILVLALVMIFQILDVGERPRVQLNPPSPFINLEDVSRLEEEVNQLIQSSWLKQLQPFIPRDEVIKLIDSQPYVASSSLVVNVGRSRLDIEIVPEQLLAVLITQTDEKIALTTAGYALREYDANEIVATVVSIYDPTGVTDTRLSTNSDEPVVSSNAAKFILDIGCFFGISSSRVVIDSCSIPTSTKLRLDRIELTEDPHQLNLFLKNDALKGIKVIMITTKDAFEQGIALSQALEFFDKEGDLPSQYIDVRLVDRAIYR